MTGTLEINESKLKACDITLLPYFQVSLFAIKIPFF